MTVPTTPATTIGLADGRIEVIGVVPVTPAATGGKDVVVMVAAAAAAAAAA
eukprot:CAMPEP_0172833264 /NCGR_PEP_ID=MMETSP1075-20121228/24239_1 /TAXON_ID=2916 /ORGANISM="Ceratium fusus, Strain PA161109" /LENGTH=50 /DNA_ID=CAMNT_0013675989 /DNA_START=264 /DNA_END=412 /DNA_ORIENTATION=+